MPFKTSGVTPSEQASLKLSKVESAKSIKQKISLNQKVNGLLMHSNSNSASVTVIKKNNINFNHYKTKSFHQNSRGLSLQQSMPNMMSPHIKANPVTAKNSRQYETLFNKVR